MTLCFKVCFLLSIIVLVEVNYMIIWVDGTYGVGKTTIATMLKEKMGDEVELLLSDYYCNATIKKIVAEAEANHRFPCIGGTLPQNNIRFLREFKELIEEKSAEKTLIIDMALTMTECKVNLYDSLDKEGQSIKHFILTADEKTIKSRIANDTDRMKDLSLDWLKDNLSFLDKNFPTAIRIKTDYRNKDDIVEEMLKEIATKEN